MRINKKSDLPKWFDLKNHDVFNNLSDAELLDQLAARLELFLLIHNRDLNDVESALGQGFIQDAHDRAALFNRHELNGGIGLKCSGGVKAISILTHHRIHSAVLEHENELDDSKKKYLLKYLYGQESVNSIMFDCDAYIEVDMSWPDEMLIDDFKFMLKTFRNKFSMKPIREDAISSWEITKKKLIEYSMFPIIDLMIWEKCSVNKITNGVLAVAVFPDGDYDSINIMQTIKPNIEKLFNFFSLEKIRRELYDRGLL